MGRWPLLAAVKMGVISWEKIADMEAWIGEIRKWMVSHPGWCLETTKQSSFWSQWKLALIARTAETKSCHDANFVIALPPPWVVVMKIAIAHYSDVIMGGMASQITSLMIVYSAVCLDTDQRKHQSSASLAVVKGIHRWPVNSPHRCPVMWKMFPFNDVIMVQWCQRWHCHISFQHLWYGPICMCIYIYHISRESDIWPWVQIFGNSTMIIPPHNEVVGGILVSLHPSVRPSFCSGVTQSQVKIIGESITLQVTKSWTIPGARPTKHISIEFEIRRKFRMPYVWIYSTDHNDILHTSRQWHCRDECKISLWSATYILHKNVLNFHRISNSIEICLVGRAPEQAWIKWSTFADVWWQFHFCRHFQMCFCE